MTLARIPTIDDVYGKIVATNDRFRSDWRTEDLRWLTNALAGEVGELCNSTKHLYGGGTHRVDVKPADLLREAADVFVYLVMVVENVRETLKRSVTSEVDHKLTVQRDRVPQFAEVINDKMDEVRARFAAGAVGDRQ